LKLTKSEIQFALIILIGSLVGLISDSYKNADSKDVILSNVIQIDSLEPIELTEAQVKLSAQINDSTSKENPIPQK